MYLYTLRQMTQWCDYFFQVSALSEESARKIINDDNKQFDLLSVYYIGNQESDEKIIVEYENENPNYEG